MGGKNAIRIFKFYPNVKRPQFKLRINFPYIVITFETFRNWRWIVQIFYWHRIFNCDKLKLVILIRSIQQQFRFFYFKLVIKKSSVQVMVPHVWSISCDFIVITIMFCMFNKIVGCNCRTEFFHFRFPQFNVIIIIIAA